MADIDRFMRSRMGKRHLSKLSAVITGKRVVGVEFSNDINCVGVTLLLDDGAHFPVLMPSLDVFALREDFKRVLLREYYKDFPERRPKEEK